MPRKLRPNVQGVSPADAVNSMPHCYRHTDTCTSRIEFNDEREVWECTKHKRKYTRAFMKRTGRI